MTAKTRVIEYLEEEAPRPLTCEELMEVFEIARSQEAEFKKVLKQLEKEGQIVKTRQDRYGVPHRMNLVVGYIQGNPRGFAFLLPEDPGEEDVFIPREGLNGAMHNDKAIVRIEQHRPGAKREGQVIRILERAHSKIVGKFEYYGNYGFVVADDSRIHHDVFVPRDKMAGAREGHKVVVELTRWPEARRNPEGEVIEILGYKGEPGVDIEGIIRKLELPRSFPAEVEGQVRNLTLEIREEDLQDRRDFRDWQTFTIDGEDARDFDDAVSIQELDGDWLQLGVHIADVAHYVREGTALDEEALNRGCSIYLVDRVIPMLPEELSNGICSLNPAEERLTMSVLMEINRNTGEVRNYEIVQGVIESKNRFTYNQVRQIVEDRDDELLTEYQQFVPALMLMKELSQRLRKKRLERGAVDFDFPEAKVILDEQGQPADIVKVERSSAEQLIEEFMILTNEVVASDIFWRDIPFIYRTHDEPDQSKIEALNEFVHNFGYHLKGVEGEIHPRAFQELIEKIKDKPEERIISTLTLRSMKQAKYTAYNTGHFGLASDCYTHFTSPIRRYPDLIIHRIIKRVLKKGSPGQQELERWEEGLPEIAEHSSVREREAMEAERDSVDLKKVEFMKDKVGEEYEGIISGVLALGFFVELPNTVEGLVHVSYLTDDYYHYQEKQHLLLGERTGNTYRIGDRVRVEVLSANLDERKIDFKLLEKLD
ncbi:MAG: ribonuclease R [Halanaerobium sp.]|nr:ribonuclease R [Halanaerobium sp.]